METHEVVVALAGDSLCLEMLEADAIGDTYSVGHVVLVSCLVTRSQWRLMKLLWFVDVGGWCYR